MLTSCQSIKKVEKKVANTPYRIYIREVDSVVGLPHSGIRMDICSNQKNYQIHSVSKVEADMLFFKGHKTKIDFNLDNNKVVKYPVYFMKANKKGILGYIKVHKEKGKPIYEFIAFNNRPKQEESHSRDWVSAWDSCGGYVALKKDGSLWQFGKSGTCDWGQISLPTINFETGRVEYRNIYKHHTKGRKIGEGFDGARIRRGSNFMYAVKKDGSLWAWGGELQPTPKKFAKSSDWIDFMIEWEGNGCENGNIGLKRDGSVWSFPLMPTKKEYLVEAKQIDKSKDWDKLLFSCGTLFGQKKDGTLWQRAMYVDDNDSATFTKIDEKYEFTSYIENLKALISRMEKIPPNSIDGMYGSSRVEVRKDGTFWLMPEVIQKKI